MKSNVLVCCLQYEAAHPVYDWCVGAENEPECPLESAFQLVCSFFSVGTASGPAVTPSNELTDQKRKNCEAVVEQIFALLEAKTHARQIMTKNVRIIGWMDLIG